MSPRGARGACLALLALGLAGAASAETPLQAYGRLRQEATAAMAAKDAALAERRLTEAARLFPHNPGLLVFLARAQAAQGHAAAAAATLGRYAREGLAYDLAGDPQLASLAAAPEARPVLAALQANTRPVGRIERTLALGAGLRPVEGVGFDPRTGRLVVSTVGGARLLAAGPDGSVAPLGDYRAGGGLFGLAVDAAHRRVWVGEAAAPTFPGAANGPFATALLCLDLDTGALVARHPLRLAGDHQLGDIALGPDGTVYASDASGGGLYRLRPGAEALERFGDTWMASPQGMAVVDGGRALIAADYSSGLHRIDLATGQDLRLEEPADTSLVGIDGVALDGADLIVTQNGVQPARVMRLRLGAGARSVRAAEALLANPPLDGGPDIALGTVVGRRFVFVARAGWADLDDNGQTPAARAAAPGLIGWMELKP